MNPEHIVAGSIDSAIKSAIFKKKYSKGPAPPAVVGAAAAPPPAAATWQGAKLHLLGARSKVFSAINLAK